MNFKHNPKLTERAKELRQNMTKEEKNLWYRFLCTYPVRFLRQKVIDIYIVDFYCAKAKLVVELDGSQHYEEENKEYDEIRTEHLKTRGLKVVRIPNSEVNRNFEGVCKYIDNEVKKRTANCLEESPHEPP